MTKHSHLPVGVTMNKNGFQAQATHRGKRFYLGTYKTVEEAQEAYLYFREQVPNDRPRINLDEVIMEARAL